MPALGSVGMSLTPFVHADSDRQWVMATVRHVCLTRGVGQNDHFSSFSIFSSHNQQFFLNYWQQVAVDQYEVSKRGQRTETGGKEKEKE